ncbi:acetyl-CoA carboxylase carboxyltransferase subunit alpha [Enhygromyxa salina]|uniref:Acetyl-coenzyme A carboxylase carboxyl transferase subunit alpha n=1 Tax=Enhygromyxa salina TaxID=215803 RepID=A0A2S9Y2I8_9BACT|nr:acetyl-CoA carboxylase carboxyltransferase subunit alpha [Enhygromyxa salina]PRP99305.1 Acetyl-coenzyme A carboxylase carboxyl transferase subunit alpha [Enhygromyxa salina]
MTNTRVLDFEKPIVELEGKIRELKLLLAGGNEDMAKEIERLEARASQLQREHYAQLSAWEQLQLAKHPDRPYTFDYVGEITTDFVELKGDRAYHDDPAIVAGMGRLRGRRVMIIGHQKGRNTKENVLRNFGMARPEGYRKCQRLMRLAQQFKLPIICLIDTAGAYPGIGAEERGQAEAIAASLELMAALRVPTISVVIGEGGSGGALAIGLTNRILMLEHAVYSVISPRGCASILWKNPEAEQTAAEQLRMTAEDLLNFGVCDGIIREAIGGAHRGLTVTAAALEQALDEHLIELAKLSPEQLIEDRYAKFRAIGHIESRADASAE